MRTGPPASWRSCSRSPWPTTACGRLGFQAGGETTTRVALHSILGCAVYGVVVVKVFAVRSKQAPGWFLPLVGGVFFAVLVAVVWTSAGWYLQSVGWPSGSGY